MGKVDRVEGKATSYIELDSVLYQRCLMLVDPSLH